MARKCSNALPGLVGFLLTVTAAQANVIITLEAFDQSGQPITGPVAQGAVVYVDLLLSVDAVDDPLPDVRLIQFDLSATTELIEIVSFAWFVDPNAYLFFSIDDPPIQSVVTAFMGSGPGLIALTTEPVKVGALEITVLGTGTLDVVNLTNTDMNYGAVVIASFTESLNFNSVTGNVDGGALEFAVGAGGDSGEGEGPGGGTGGTNPQPNDYDGDGVPNGTDAFPTDPTESVDTNNDGIGNNADPDDDGDGVVDTDDEFPIDAAEAIDTDGDLNGDNEDPDRDGDNVANDGDAFPDDPAEAMDTDDDGIGNNADLDDDQDGVADPDDAFPLDASQGGESNDNMDVATASAPSMCGAGMLGPGLLMFLGLCLMPGRSRRQS